MSYFDFFGFGGFTALAICLLVIGLMIKMTNKALGGSLVAIATILLIVLLLAFCVKMLRPKPAY